MSILSVKHVTKHFGGVHALDSCSFEIKEGEILGLIGPNGSGKTTMFNVITGVHESDAGEVSYKGENVTNSRTYEVAAMGISRTFQLIRLFPKLTVMENMLLGQKYETGENFWPQLVSKRKVEEEDESKRKKALELLRLVNLQGKADELAENLSYGQQKLLEIVRAVANEPRLLLLDEPIAGVNPTMAKQILSLIRKLNKDGTTILIIEHNMNVMMKFCNRLVVLDYGKEIAAGKPSQVRKNRKVIGAYLGRKKR